LQRLYSKPTVFGQVLQKGDKHCVNFCSKFWVSFRKYRLQDDLYTFDENKLELSNRVVIFLDNVIVLVIIAPLQINKFGAVFIDNVSTSGFVSLEFETND
jgi:phosphohistidine phosphatase